jgi:hypothetical protein
MRYLAEVVAEARLHEGAWRGVERAAGTVQHLADDGRRDVRRGRVI